MEAWINNFTNWIPIGGLYYALLGLLAFVESMAFIGILCPGSVLIIFTGFLAANGKGDFLILAIVYSIGAISGDLLSYLLGARAGGAIMQRPWFQKREKLLNKAQLYFAEHGGKSVFIGRFVGFLRPFIPFIAGSARMNPLAFFLYALVSGVLWGISYPGLGYLCGASWQMVQVWSGRFSLLILFLAVLFLLNALLWRYFVPWLGRAGRFLGRKIAADWQKLLNTSLLQSFFCRHPRLWRFIGERFTTEHESGLCLTIGLTICTCLTALFFWVGRGITLSSGLSHLDQRLYELLAVLHHPWTDIFFATITWLGSGQVMIILVALVLLTLLVNNRDFSALIFAGGMIVGELFNALVNAIYARPRPTPFFPGLEAIGTSFPSGHAFSALLFYGLVIYFLIGTTRNWRARFALILAGSFIVLLVGFSRIFLGVHWASDVLAGFVLAALWLSFLITLSETRFRYGGFGLQKGWRPFKFSLRTRLFLLVPAATLSIILIVTIIAPKLHPRSLERSERPHQIMAALDLQDPGLMAELPLMTQSLWGAPQQSLSLIIAADESVLQERLSAAGWRPAQRVGLHGFKILLVDLLQKRLQNEATIIPQLVDGETQDFSLVMAHESDPAVFHSLLIWDLNRRLSDGRTIWGILLDRQVGVRHLLSIPLPLPRIASAQPDEVAKISHAFCPAGSHSAVLILPLPESLQK